jgi:hypothetical protein
VEKKRVAFIGAESLDVFTVGEVFEEEVRKAFCYYDAIKERNSS